ncbi:type VI secretion system tip protein VgrG [Enterobacter cloacae]|uniref:type VI secretion system Vgr family protein n=1 Tax=Enterobacter cloacae complex TaxID=354276 RepID=UPI00210EFE4F|nr:MULTISPECIES: type VI secretion system Vgr family protein [Enterobacter cloacae complex]MCQ4444812.1 type VI secretion system tip protein VgrG [Enterobacter cloacae]MDW2870153.1 type VI secretion system tip protein VgrG [Enterobacter hormaechei]
MNGREIRFSHLPVVFNPEESLNKYLLTISGSDLIADVESFTGEEALSTPYRYTIRFTSTTDDAEAFHTVQKEASFILRAANPAWSKYFPDCEKWVALRKIPGVITELSRISSSVEETLYEAVLEHPLALLNARYRSAIYQNVSVPELVKHILKEHGFEGYEINFDLLHWEYPPREMIVQWKESDLGFIQRLLSEVGIWFRFELHPDHDHIVVIVFGDSGAHYVHNHKIAAITPAGTVGNIYSLRKMTTRHTIVPGSVDVRNYNYRESRNYRALETQADKSRQPELVYGGEYHYADNHLASGDRYAIGKGQHAETSWHYARIRHECQLTNMITLEAVADDPAIVPGFDLDITGNKPAAFDEGMVVTSIRSTGSRKSSFQSEIKGIPFSEIWCYRPERLPRPIITGTIPARVSGISINDQLSRIDNQGRYRVQFNFDQAEWKKGLESMPVRLGRQYAGDTYGIHFPLLDNTEVGIAFENGDPERPFIAHAFHDEINPDVVTDRNSTRNVIRTPRNNKFRMEDKKNHEHIKVATEYGKSQLNLGHLVDASGKRRGEGVELRTDKQASLRSAEGFHITTEAKLKATGNQNDMAATIAQLESALQLARSLQASSEIADTPAADLSSVTELRQRVAKPEDATLSLHGETGIALTSPKSVLLHAGENMTTTSRQDMNANAFRRMTLAAGEVFSVFVRKAGMVFTAAKGSIRLTAQKGEINVVANQNINLTSSQGKIVLNAQDELLLMCGGAGIRLKKGEMEFIAPHYIRIKAPAVDYMAKASLDHLKPTFSEGELAQQFRLHAPDDPDHILKGQRFRLHKKGEVIEGITDDNGESPLLNTSELDTWSLELVHELEAPEGIV